MYLFLGPRWLEAFRGGTQFTLVKEKAHHVFFDQVDTAGVSCVQAVLVNDQGQTLQPFIPALG
jgi:hypothetical protein